MVVQFKNELSKWENGMTRHQMTTKCKHPIV